VHFLVRYSSSFVALSRALGLKRTPVHATPATANNEANNAANSESASPSCSMACLHGQTT
jgi:hypothetical protein